MHLNGVAVALFLVQVDVDTGQDKFRYKVDKTYIEESWKNAKRKLDFIWGTLYNRLNSVK